MTTQLTRIAKEQLTQSFVSLSDRSFVEGALQLGVHVQAVAGTLSENGAYVIHLAPAGAAGGCLCGFTVSVGATSKLSIKDGPTVLLNEATNKSVQMVLFCDGYVWRIVWDHGALTNLAVGLSSTQTNVTELQTSVGNLQAKIFVPVGGEEEQVLAKGSDVNGDLNWITVPMIPAGGTSGQVLAKASDDDFDLAWVNK